LALREIPIHIGSIVEEVSWKRAAVHITAQSRQGNLTFSASRALVTFPLAVLQRSTETSDSQPHFDPALPSNKLESLDKLTMGKVVRVVLCFRRRIWADVKADGKTLANMSFLISENEFFPTWWTRMPDPVSLITGWSPAHSAELLSGMSESRVVDKALESLAS